MGIADELRKKAKVYQDYADRLRRMAEEIERMEAVPAGAARAPSSPPVTKTPTVRRMRGGQKTKLSSAIAVIRKIGEPMHLEDIYAHVKGDQRLLRKTLDRAVKRGVLQRTAAATYDLPSKK